jgi:hypothetical protein
MKRIGWAALIAGCLSLGAGGTARAQDAGGVVSSYQTRSIYGAPGDYGVAWGVPSYGVPRLYSEFSSPYGLGYGYGYPPYSYLPGRYGVGLWRPGFSEGGYVFAASSYRTFPVPYRPLVPSYGPPLGYYAPGFGPPSFFAD